MERNWELIRKILLKLAEKADDSPMESDVFAKFSAETTAYHYKILAQAGLIEVEECATLSGVDYAAIQLTWQGHELLDQIRNDTVWNKIKATVKNKGLDLSFELIKTAGKKVLSALL